MSDAATRAFFDDMALTYDADVGAVGWDPIGLLASWPFVLEGDVLEIGCGTGNVLAHAAATARSLAGMDLSTNMILLAHQKLARFAPELRVASANAPLPFAADRFDRVVALAVMEFVDDLSDALREISRVLAPGGRALVTVEDLHDMHGIAREPTELRYGVFPLHRRERDTVEACVPPTLSLVRIERRKGYTVIERDFTCAYWVIELVR